MTNASRVSLAELLSGSPSFTVDSAVALVRQLCRQLPVTSTGPGSTRLLPEHIWLTRNGAIQLSPGVVGGVRELGALLEQLLAEVRRGGPQRFPPALVLVAARATGRIDAAPIVSPEALFSALSRFEPPDPIQALRALLAAARTQPDAFLPAGPGATVVPGPNVLAPVPRASIGVVRVVAASGALGLAVGVALALTLPSATPHSAVPRAATEVVISPPATVERGSANASDRSSSHRSIKPLASSPKDTTGRRSSPRPSSAGRMDAPRPLLDRDLVNAEALFSPSFASNGSAVFFHALSGSGTALKRAERGDSGVLHVATIVDDGAKNYHLQLSPDGDSFAFDSDRDGVRAVYIARADGSRVQRVSGAGYAAVPTWSTDGSRLAFLRAEADRARVWNLWMLDLRSGSMTRLTNYRYGQVWGGAWFPDGRRIAYTHEDRLVILDIASGDASSYVSPLKGRVVRTPAVSPDGRSIVFQVFRDGGWLLNVDSGSMRRVLDDPSAEEFAWSPDGRQVAFHSRRSGQWGLWMVTAQ